MARDLTVSTAKRPAETAPTPSILPERSLTVLAGLAGLLLLFLVLPLVALFLRASTTSDFWTSLQQPMVLEALRLTLISSLICLLLAIVTGTPLAWILARKEFPGKRILDTMVDLPLILPPVVAGVALLMAFGRRGLLGEQLDVIGISIPFTLAAVVMAQLFIAVPFYVRGAKVGFQSVDRHLEHAAALDGASSWQTIRHVTVPVALPAISSGAMLCWARAVSEFGATLLFAGNITGRTQTMPLAIMSAMETNLGAALALSVVLVLISGCTLFFMRLFLSPRSGS
jgi:molybdate transport system permease protein